MSDFVGIYNNLYKLITLIKVIQMSKLLQLIHTYTLKIDDLAYL